MDDFAQALRVLQYSIAEKLGCLKPNFIESFHGTRRDQVGEWKSFDLLWTREKIFALLTFYYGKDVQFPVEEVLHRLRHSVNEEEMTKYKNALKIDFGGKIHFGMDSVNPVVRTTCQSIMATHEMKEPDGTEPRDFVEDFFLILRNDKPEFPEQSPSDFKCSFKDYRGKSIDLALRSPWSERWRFNRMWKLSKQVCDHGKALELIAIYEYYIFSRGQCGLLKWVFSTTKVVIDHYNRRSSNLSNFSRDIRVLPETRRHEEDEHFLSHGKENDKGPGKVENFDILKHVTHHSIQAKYAYL